MKIRLIFIALILNSISTINNICIEGENCPIGKGFCRANNCICLNNYWSIINKGNSSPTIYCNYKKYNRFLILIIEFFIPSLGHLISGKYYFFIIKFLLLLIPFIIFLYGYLNFRNESSIDKKNTNVYQPTREDENEIIFSNSLDEQLHIANRKKVNIDKSTYIFNFFAFLCLISFMIMHIMDIICYLFGLYSDGNGAPFA